MIGEFGRSASASRASARRPSRRARRRGEGRRRAAELMRELAAGREANAGHRLLVDLHLRSRARGGGAGAGELRRGARIGLEHHAPQRRAARVVASSSSRQAPTMENLARRRRAPPSRSSRPPPRPCASSAALPAHHRSRLRRADGRARVAAAPVLSGENLQDCLSRARALASPRKHIALLGSTGSIGTQTLDICREYPEAFEVISISAGANVELLASAGDRVQAEGGRAGGGGEARTAARAYQRCGRADARDRHGARRPDRRGGRAGRRHGGDGRRRRRRPLPDDRGDQARRTIARRTRRR